MAVTIQSPSLSRTAVLTDTPDGVYVAVRCWDGIAERQIWAGTIDAPFHVVADRMVDTLAEMEAEMEAE